MYNVQCRIYASMLERLYDFKAVKKMGFIWTIKRLCGDILQRLCGYQGRHRAARVAKKKFLNAIYV